ncbi:MAG: PLxRFG domain-containing protein [Burkholderiales bacterium]
MNTLTLAQKIAKLTGATVFDGLTGKSRASVYDTKKAGGNVAGIDLGMTMKAGAPAGRVFVVDGVTDTGATADAALAAAKAVGMKPTLLVYAKSAGAQQAIEQPGANKAGAVVIPASEEAFADALNQAENDERLDATFKPSTTPVSLPLITSARPKPNGVTFLTSEQATAKIDEWKAEAARQGRKLAGKNANRTVISLFDASGVLAKPWVEAGYNVVTYDLQTGDDINEFSAENLLEQHGNDEVWAILAQPPCTDFASSGAQFWKKKDEDGRTEASNELVRQVLRTVELFRPPVWVMENPVGRIAKLNNLPKPTLTFDPWNFGDPYTKRTLLWGNFDPNLPTAMVEPVEGSKIIGMSSSAKYERSLTSEPFAYAMFMANNAESMSQGKRLAAEFAGVEASLLDAALKAGKSERDIRTAIEDDYNDGDLEAVRDALRGMGASPTPASKPAAPTLVTHVTGKGNVLSGIVRTDLSQAEAKQIDPYTFKKDDGWFIREKYLNEPPAPDAAEQSLTQLLIDEIRANRMPKDNVALRKLVEKFDGGPASPTRMKQAQEATEAAIVETARELVAKKEGPRSTYGAMVRLYESQPLLNVRTSTSIANQAYSTPAPLAFVASELAGIDRKTVVLEPTAGNGMLLIAASPERAVVNEINDERVESLRSQGFNPTQRDAATEQLRHAGYPVDAVITNPPFGPIKNDKGESIKVKFDGYTLGQIDHLIAARALSAMKDDGNAVLIIGANKVTGEQSNNDLIFFNWLYGHYNVTSHFEVDGDLYLRQGAGWPVRVITINGRQQSATVAPQKSTITRASTWDEVYEQFQQSLGSKRPATRTGDGAVSVRPGGVADDSRAVPVPAGKQTGRVDSGRPEGRPPGDGNVAGKRPAPVDDRGAQPGQVLGEQSGAVGSNDQAPGPVEGERIAPRPRAAKPARDTRTAGVAPTAQGNDFQTTYVARSSRKDNDVLIPVNMAGPLQSALDRLEDEVGDLDEFVALELGYDSVNAVHNAFMGLQVDSIASAIHQIKNGKGVIIADQTGIGKGRQAAGVIRWAAKNGRIPVFVSVKPSLFTDMYGDLHDIGSDDISPLIMNVDESIKDANGNALFTNKPGPHKRTLDDIAATGTLPSGRNALFMTYSQINVPNRQRQAVLALAPNAVFILDESHNAGGDSQTGQFMRDALGLAGGVTYLSATYAKRPDNMPLYFKTDIGDAVASDAALTQAMADGGLPLQTVVSNNLVKAGQMFRRERSYKGVNIESRADTAHRAEHVKLSNETTLALRAIVEADRVFHHTFIKSLNDDLKAQGARVLDIAGNQAEASVDHTQFTSIVHNFVRQMLLGLKAQESADEAIRSLKRGEKPLIAVENTMGSFLAEYAADNNLKPGDPLTNYDYRTVLSRALDRTRYYVRQLPNGDKEKVYVPVKNLNPDSLVAYRKAQSIIDKLNINIPVSPIDWMRDQISKAGYSVAEITGRDFSVDYTDPKNPKLDQIDPLEQKDKVRTTRQFNDGSLDAIILNVAGSTGISLHASEKFKDQRQRHMIVAQAAQDINIFMQMLGRIHRTGQVRLPKYTLLSADLPAEIRPTALLSGKMKSLNANTSSNTESATSVKAADMLNKYGDQIVAQYLEDNPELARSLDINPNDGPEDIARRATGRLALMSIKTQEAFYEEVQEQYQALIDYLNKTNQNELEPRTFDFDARKTKEETLFEGQNKASPFGEDATYGEYSVKAQGKAMTPAEIQSLIAQHLGGKTAAEHMRALSEPLQAQFLKMRDGMTEEQRPAADDTARKTAHFLDSHPIGSMFRLDINEETYNAVITNIRSTHKSAGNPLALSKVQVTVAVNGALRSVTVPATQFEKITVNTLSGYGSSIPQLFREKPADERETAKIITGNLLGAYGQLQGARGTIISFTKTDGTIEQGILLPKKFNFAKDVRQDYRLKKAEDVFAFLQGSTNPNVARFGVGSRDNLVRVLPNGSGIAIQVPKTKAKGGKYFLDKKILEAAGEDFASQGNTMRLEVSGRAASVRTLEVLMNKEALYAAPSMAAEARDLVGDPAPVATKPGTNGVAFSRSQAPDERNALKALSESDDMFKWGKSDKDDLEGIVADLIPGAKVKLNSRSGIRTDYQINMPDGSYGRLVVLEANPYAEFPGQRNYGQDYNGKVLDRRPGENPEDVPADKGDLWIDVSMLKGAGAGQQIYNVAANFAHNTDRVFIGDPSGLSDDALRRRTDNMLSSALKFGTTDHIAPHPRQVAGDAAQGVPPLRWVYGDHLGNIRGLIDQSLAAQQNAGADFINFDLASGQFLDSEGQRLSRADVATTSVLPAARAARAGDSSLARGSILRALSREEGGERGGRDGRSPGLLARLVRLGAVQNAATRGIFYSRSNPVDRRGAARRIEEVTKLAGEITARWTNAPKVVVVDSLSDPRVPAAIRKEDARQQSQGAKGAPEGIYFKGTVYLVASELPGQADVVRVLFHEALGHYGLRGVFGKNLNTILDRLAILNQAKVRAKTKQYGLDYDKPRDRRAAAEEVLAEMAQTRPEIGWVRRAIAAIRTFLREHVPGFARMKMSDAEIISQFILPARRFVEKGGAASANDTPTFSRATQSAARAAARRILEGGVQSRNDLRDMLREPGFSQWAESAIVGDVAATRALRDKLEAEFGLDWRAPKLTQQGIVSFYAGWAKDNAEGVKTALKIAQDAGAPAAVRGAADPGTKMWSDLTALGMQPYRGMQEFGQGRRPSEVAFKMIMPAGGITATTPLFSRSSTLFYSELAEAIERATMNAGSAESWTQLLKGMTSKGVKADEIEWSGLPEWLALQQDQSDAMVNRYGPQDTVVDGNGKVIGKSSNATKISKQQILDYLDANGVKVTETVLADADNRVMGPDDIRSDLTSDLQGRDTAWLMGHYEAELEQAPPEDATRSQLIADIVDAKMTYYEANPGDYSPAQTRAGTARYSKYTLPGGTNYREVLLTLPRGSRAIKASVRQLPNGRWGLFDGETQEQTFATEDAARHAAGMMDGATVALPGQQTYKSSHWDQPNVLAHLRINDRTDADGKRVLFVEEIQSDWGQEGRKKGFMPRDQAASIADLTRQLDEAKAARNRLIDDDVDDNDPRLVEAMRRVDELAAARRETGAGANMRTGIPVAPFVTKTDGWLPLALKRVVMMAVDEGYDRVAFVTGQQAADRFDLSKQISYLAWRGGDFRAYDLKGEPTITRTGTSQQDVADLVGKEVAERLFSQKPTGEGRNALYTLSGENLKVGGDGMKTFYDTIIPTTLKKLLPKVGGGQMGTVQIAADRSGGQYVRSGMTQPGFDVTPAMREKAEGGLPMFSRANPTDTPKFKSWFGNSKAVNDAGKPVVLYRGHQFGTGKNKFTFYTDSPKVAETYATRWGDASYELRVGGDSYKFETREEALAAKKGNGGRVVKLDNSPTMQADFLSLQNPLVVDAKGAQWNMLRNPFADPAAVAKYEKDLAGVKPMRLQGRPYSVEQQRADITRENYFSVFTDTNGLAALAKKNGHDGLIVRNVYDVGQTVAFSAEWQSDVYVAFRPDQIQSAIGNNEDFDAPNVNGEAPMFSRSSQTQTPEFKKWFGRSKVSVNGKPRMVYHGTYGEIGDGVFKTNPLAEITGTEDPNYEDFFLDADMLPSGAARSLGSWFSSSPATAATYGNSVVPTFLKIENPVNWGEKELAEVDYSFSAAVDDFEAGDRTARARRIEAAELAMQIRSDLIRKGHDGIIIKRDDGTIEYVVFKPTQIKSAIGNNGQFDPTNPDIRFSRSPAEVLRGINQTSIRNAFLDATTSHDKVNLWAKTVGTQYDKAQRNPQTFGRVFNAVQDYIKDISSFANAAADQAPSILPKLDNFRDLVRKDASRADLNAVGAVIFQGTLNKQLLDRPALLAKGLTPKQADLYEEFRAAVNQSLEDMAKTELVRLAGDAGAMVANRALAQPTSREAADILAEAMREQGMSVDADNLYRKVEMVEKLKAQGYAPLMRFGKHTVHIQQDGETMFFGMYESRMEANAMARQLRGDPKFAGALVEQGVMSQESYKLFNGLSIDSLELFANEVGGQNNPVYQDFLKLTKNNRSALKRLIQRKGTAGFSTNTERVLASFVTSNARLAAGNLHLGRAKQAANDIPKEMGDLKDEAVRLVEYVQNPQEEAQAVRGLLFTTFIGGSVASALVNMTQPFTMTLPYLSQYGGLAKAGMRMLAALKIVAGGKATGELAQALKRAEADGIVSPQEIHHLQAATTESLGNHPYLKKAAFIWGSMFSLAEQFNRRLSFVAAYQTALDNKVANPFAFAEKAVIETQGLYNKGNKANWARGAIGSTAMTFKQYSTHYIEWLTRMHKSGPEGRKAAITALAILLLTAGAGGLPFADDLDDLIDTLAQAMGYDFSSKQAKRKFIAETLGLGDTAAEVATRGITALPGFPMDLSMRMGMGNLLPATGIFLRSNTDRSRDLLEVAGAAGSLAKMALEGGEKLLQGDVLGAAKAVVPLAIQNMAKSAQMWETGEYRNQKGAKVTDVDGLDAAMKFVGFQPAEVARESAKVNAIQRTIQLAKNVESDLAGRMAQARVDGDIEAEQKARQELIDWNRKNPDSPIRIRPADIARRARELRASRADRLIKSAPKELRPAVSEALN